MAEENNPFMKLAESHRPPPALKERVMTSVELSQMLMEVTDLFTDKMGRAALSLFETSQDDPDESQANNTPPS